MMSIEEIRLIILIGLFYLMIIPFQLVIFPKNYYSVKDAIYEKDFKKACKALASRFMFIFVLCTCLWLINKRNHIVVWGISFGAFLCTWPSVYHYQLFLFWKGKSQLLYFLACIVSVHFSYFSSKFIVYQLLPALFEEKSVFALDNGALSFILSVIQFCLPFGIRKIINKNGQENPYMDCDTFPADLCMTIRKMQFDKDFIDHYLYELSDAANKFHISAELLSTVLQLERINRGSFYIRIIERIAVKWFKPYLIKRDATIGMAQVKISTAKSYFHCAPQNYLSEMIKPEISICLCAYIIRTILDKYSDAEDAEIWKDYQDLIEDDHYNENMKLSLYIASQYICGINVSLKKYVLVYATIINGTSPICSLSVD